MAAILPTQRDAVEGTFGSEDAWRASLRNAVRRSTELCERIGLKTEDLDLIEPDQFPILVPQEFIDRIKPGDPKDPLLLQVLAQSKESEPSGSLDPVGELPSQRQKGLLQKYAHRVLLILSGQCAVHCRYCFRRNFPYEQSAHGREAWQEWLDTLQSDTSIEEVILSGGDPLTIGDSRLRWFLEELNSIPHLRRLRFHTRLPVVIPQRVTEALQESIRISRCTVYVVLHINHAQEIDAALAEAVRRLRLAGAVVLNQAVLLREVNDSPAALRDLCLRLTDLGVIPYYLHQLDPVRGGMHFQVSDEVATSIIEELRHLLPGYALPSLVRETSGEPSKTPIYG